VIPGLQHSRVAISPASKSTPLSLMSSDRCHTYDSQWPYNFPTLIPKPTTVAPEEKTVTSGQICVLTLDTGWMGGQVFLLAVCCQKAGSTDTLENWTETGRIASSPQARVLPW
jgi:hypothetical protein